MEERTIEPVITIGIPVFNRNQGGRARAEAEMQRATASYAATQQRVAADPDHGSVIHRVSMGSS